MAESPVLYERRGVAALLIINRPEARSAINGAVASALPDGYRRFADDDDAKALVLTGARFGGEAASACGVR
jgi:enoyl-CoA hydratase/carnithine racemase